MTPRRFYEVVVAGHVGATLADSFAPLSVHIANGETTIPGPGLDAAALAGVLRAIERMGLDLVAISSQVDESADRRRRPRRQSNSSPCAVTAHTTSPLATSAMQDQIG